MSRLVLFAIVATGCSFRPGTALSDAGGGDDVIVNDGIVGDGLASDASDAAPCVPGFLDLCSVAAPTMPFVVALTDSINTDTDPRCVVVIPPTGRRVCLINATAVSLATGSTVVAYGLRPLAIRSTSTIVVDGTLDVGSYRGGKNGAGANDTSCALGAQAPEDDIGGAGGAAGGSFGGVGGAGGLGDSDNSLGNDGTALAGQPGAVGSITYLRGGCPGGNGGNESSGGGQGGAAASGGGAVYLVAATAIVVTATGRIRATGAGGNPGEVQAGGGGAGSGGLVVLESLMSTIAGMISANGGGGGEGGARIGGLGDVTGNPGFDGDYGNLGASGGSGIDSRMGYGGGGGAGSTADGTVGVASLVGGGGGGGAVGAVRILGAKTISGSISPPAP